MSHTEQDVKKFLAAVYHLYIAGNHTEAIRRVKESLGTDTSAAKIYLADLTGTLAKGRRCFTSSAYADILKNVLGK